MPMPTTSRSPDPDASRTQPAALGQPKLGYIDCLRGYAVLMVIATHTTHAFTALPYPVHSLASFGWHGVQLFFLASSVTLMMSAHNERARTGGINLRNFYIRRFLRIAPMYYLAAAFYWLYWPPAETDLTQLLTTLTFTNDWHPVTTPTTGAWMVVPGGWSISAEFAFYFLFPLFAAVATTVPRTALILLSVLVLGAVVNSMYFPQLAGRYGVGPTNNFLYYWPLNQAPVFVVGALSFLAIRNLDAHPDGRAAQLLRRWSGLSIALALGLVLLVAKGPFDYSHHLRWAPAIPQYLAASVAMALFIVAMSQARRSMLINPVVAAIGKVSFSIYLLHFAVIGLIREYPDLFRLRSEGWTAIAAFAGVAALVTVVSYIVSRVTYALVEEPFIRYAKHLTRRRVPIPESAAAA
jgi:peptidoglycan/LPS O-acetylase OafA/YrhL